MPSPEAFGSSSAEAVQAYIDRVQRQVSCVSSVVVDVGGGYYVSPHPHTLVVANGDTFRVRGASRLAVELSQAYLIVSSDDGRYQVQVVTYAYGVLDIQGREILSYQWHPNSISHVRTPHLHLGAGSLVGREELQRSHLPTGFVELHQILRLLIEEFQVTPQRADWDDLLR